MRTGDMFSIPSPFVVHAVIVDDAVRDGEKELDGRVINAIVHHNYADPAGLDQGRTPPCSLDASRVGLRAWRMSRPPENPCQQFRAPSSTV
jgi:hypothetical protein